MAKASDNPLTDSLRRLETMLARTRDDFADLKLRMADVGQAGSSAQSEVLLAGISNRLDQADERLHRIEHRIDLVMREIENAPVRLEACK
ncbi:MAG TPA: hypothetical protein VEQ35_04570 [Beijerinckia sp.]|jgi:hypothetical protein|nr:hypothetical protein [Beijerinckia sp.]